MVEANRKKNSVPFPSRNGHENPKLVSMMGANKWNSNFGLELSLQENRTTLSVQKNKQCFMP